VKEAIFLSVERNAKQVTYHGGDVACIGCVRGGHGCGGRVKVKERNGRRVENAYEGAKLVFSASVDLGTLFGLVGSPS
jgi:hypothetical protein